MTKKQLLKKLEKVSDETEIIVASDSEGNAYNKLSQISIEEGLKFFYQDRELYLLNKEDIGDYEVSEEKYNKMKDCVVLYP